LEVRLGLKYGPNVTGSLVALSLLYDSGGGLGRDAQSGVPTDLGDGETRSYMGLTLEVSMKLVKSQARGWRRPER